MNNFYGLILIPILASSLFAEELPENIKMCIEKSEVTEDNELNGPHGCTELLMRYMKTNWRSVLGDLGTIAPTDPKKCRVMRACESLPPEEYLQFLNETRDMYAAKKLSTLVFQKVLWASRYKEGFLAMNYQVPAVRSFVESLFPICPAEWHDSFRGILSGVSKTDYEKTLRYEERQLEEGVLLASQGTPPGVQSDTIGNESAVSPDSNGRDSSQTSVVAQSPGAFSRGRTVWLWAIGLAAGIILIAMFLRKAR